VAGKTMHVLTNPGIWEVLDSKAPSKISKKGID